MTMLHIGSVKYPCHTMVILVKHIGGKVSAILKLTWLFGEELTTIHKIVTMKLHNFLLIETVILEHLLTAQFTKLLKVNNMKPKYTVSMTKIHD